MPQAVEHKILGERQQPTHSRVLLIQPRVVQQPIISISEYEPGPAADGLQCSLCPRRKFDRTRLSALGVTGANRDEAVMLF
jgi:hypothetical protein